MDQVELRITKTRRVESRVAWVQIDQTADLLGVSAIHRAQLFAADRMSNKNRFLNMERGHDSKYIVAKAVGRIILTVGGWIAGLTEAPSGNAVHVIFADELRREAVIHMRRVAQAGKKDERPARATPIEHLKLDS